MTPQTLDRAAREADPARASPETAGEDSGSTGENSGASAEAEASRLRLMVEIHHRRTKTTNDVDPTS